MKHFLLFLFTSILFTVNAQEPVINDSRLKALEPAFEKLLKDWKAPGFAVAVVYKNKVIYTKGFGYRDMDKKLPVTTNTLFAIGSVTKSFTSSLLGILENEGKVDFNKPATTYLPELAFYNDQMNNGVTLRHMMSHQTGLPRHDLSWYFFNTNSRDSMIRRVQFQEPTAGIRERWQYNNFMFAAQGAIVEKLTGSSWEKMIDTKLFDPLEMNRSNTSIPELQKSEDVALGYGLKNDSIIKKLDYYHINAMAPAGSINSSANEMTAWLVTWINGGKYKNKEILPAKYVIEAITPQALVGPGLPDKEKPDLHFSTYGFGWLMSSYRGHYRVEHGGNIDGFSANASFFPTDSIGIVVLTNQNGSSIPSIVRNTIADKLLGLKPYNWSADLKKTSERNKALALEMARSKQSKKSDSKPSHPIKDYEGDYSQPGYGVIEVYSKNDSLFAKLGDKHLWLRHSNYDVFDPFMIDLIEGIDTTGGSSFPMQFHLNITGEVESLSVPFESGLNPLVFKRQPKEIKVTSHALKIYEGEYELGGVTAKFYTKGGNTLYLFVPGQPEYELVATGTNKFSLKSITGYHVEFNKDSKGEVNEVTFIQPNGNFKASKKK